MNEEPPPIPSLPPKKPIAVPLVLAFGPSAIVLLLFASDVPKSQMTGSCVTAAILSIVCCVVPSFMLFQRNTAAAIIFGILLALLNVTITAGLGCVAMFADMNIH